jgi:multiple sugar transport system permease protein
MIKTKTKHRRPKFLRPKYIVKFIISLLKAIFIAGICFTILYPLISKFSMSLMDQRDLYDRLVKFIPMNFRLSNYPELIGYMSYWKALGNSMILSTLVALLQTLSTVAVGYGFAKYKFRGRGILFACVLITMIVPQMMTITPLYLNFKSFNFFGLIPSGSLLGNFTPFAALSLTAVAPRCALYIFLARQYFRGVPKEIEEAASIDGAGAYKIFYSIMLKTAKPIMVTIFLFSFVWQYNDTMFTGIMNSGYDTVSKRLYLLNYAFSNAISMDASGTAGNIGYVSIMQATGTLMTILPLLIIYMFFQKQFVQSVERTGLVG